ncbi:MAG: hypothetical protein ACYDEJ_07865 [Desulfitobacteriaceae bacterium]
MTNKYFENSVSYLNPQEETKEGDLYRSWYYINKAIQALYKSCQNN